MTAKPSLLRPFRACARGETVQRRDTRDGG